MFEAANDPNAGLYRIAHNHVLDELRRAMHDAHYLAEAEVDYAEQGV